MSTSLANTLQISDGQAMAEPWLPEISATEPHEAEPLELGATARSAFELVLRDGPALDAALLDAGALPGWIQRLLGLSVLGLVVHGLAVGLVVQSFLGTDAARGWLWLRGTPILWMAPALTGALLGALAICLPSFYFYTQLSGLDASFRLVTAQALRVQARTSVLLLAALPFYVALALGCAVWRVGSPDVVVAVGLALPFVVGLAGIESLHRGFRTLLGVLPITHRRRGNFLLRMVLCWGAVYSTVAPVALYRLGELLSRIF